MRHKMSSVVVLSAFLLTSAFCIAETNKANPESNNQDVIYTLDFAKASKESQKAREWLEKDGFIFKSDAGSERKINISFKDEALNFKSKAGVFGILLKELNISGANKVRIIWGVNKYPKNASYKNGVNNEALMVYIYFGKEKLDSGSMFIPGSPYFLGLFLGKTEDLNKACIGKHFKEGGRFICVGMPKPGETVVSEFDLSSAFKNSFGKPAPFISAIALEAETSNSGPADGFIKKIEFLK